MEKAKQVTQRLEDPGRFRFSGIGTKSMYVSVWGLGMSRLKFGHNQSVAVSTGHLQPKLNLGLSANALLIVT